MDGLMQNIDFNNIQILNPGNSSSKGEYLCSSHCGEAGCVLWKDKYQCMCAEGDRLFPPDENLRCDRFAINPVDIRGKPPDREEFPFWFKNTEDTDNNNSSASQPLVTKEISTESVDGNFHLETIKIVVPVAGATLLIIFIILSFILRRRRSFYNRTPKADSPISWLYKQDREMLLENMAVVSKNLSYHFQEFDANFLENLKDKLIPKDQIQLLQTIGEGAFGKVYKGEIRHSEENIQEVAVKILKEDASRETREDFKREVTIMSSFEHENILKLIGVVAIENECPFMVFEYMQHGDLTELLRKNDPTASKAEQRSRKLILKQTDLVDIATQIANGMVYLTSRHFVHRDLATRNCLVGSDLVVKISDFGMSRDIYTCDYYKIGGSRLLPVRWMSPQSMKYGRFTTESDVWSYGVVLWEIFSYGKQPYYGHSNEEVIRFIEDGILLQRPTNCADTIYHVMLGCWRREPADRFTFQRIHRHLKDFSRKMVKCYHEHNIETGVDLHHVEQV